MTNGVSEGSFLALETGIRKRVEVADKGKLSKLLSDVKAGSSKRIRHMGLINRRVAIGARWVTKLRCGGVTMTPALVEANWLDAKYRERCPVCLGEYKESPTKSYWSTDCVRARELLADWVNGTATADECSSSINVLSCLDGVQEGGSFPGRDGCNLVGLLVVLGKLAMIRAATLRLWMKDPVEVTDSRVNKA